MADSSISQSLDKIVTHIQDLDLTDIPDARVTRKVVLLDQNYSMPEIRVVPWGGEVVDSPEGTNARDDWVYPVLVGILDAFGNVTDGEKQFKWRERIKKRFHNKTIGLSIATKKCTVQPLAIVDREAWRDHQIFVSALLVRVHLREDRDYTLP